MLPRSVREACRRFSIPALEPGAYDVTFTLPGFTTAVRDAVRVNSGETAVLDVEMAIRLEERVAVVGSRAQPRSVIESTVPIDAIPYQDVVSQGSTDVGDQLRTLVPSYNWRRARRVAGGRPARRARGRGPVGRERERRLQRGGLLHPRHRQRLTRPGHADHLRSGPLRSTFSPSSSCRHPLHDRVHLAGGAEWRDERFTIGLGGALRLEDFEDFGTTTNGKLSGRLRLGGGAALRASASSGFRAPTPGQQNAFNVSTEYDHELMDLVNNGTIPSTSRVAALRGGEALQPERSVSTTIGTVADAGPFSLTADYFRIRLADRLALTQLFADRAGGRGPARRGGDERPQPAELPLLHQPLRDADAGPRPGRDLRAAAPRRPDDAGPALQPHCQQEANPIARAKGNRFSVQTPFGANGAFFYVRINYRWASGN